MAAEWGLGFGFGDRGFGFGVLGYYCSGCACVTGESQSEHLRMEGDGWGGARVRYFRYFEGGLGCGVRGVGRGVWGVGFRISDFGIGV